MSELPNRGDRKLILSTLREIPNSEAEAGVLRNIPVALDSWDASFTDYVAARKTSRLYYCEYRPGVHSLFCPADKTGIWAARMAEFTGKGIAQEATIVQLAQLVREKGLG